MRLSVLAGTPLSGEDPDIAGLTADSRAIKPGMLFAALAGAKADGASFVADAISKGAAAILGRESIRVAAGRVPFLADENPRRRLALLAAAFYQKQPETIVAVTGTNGKTSVASFVRQIWASLGHPSASFGTVGVVSPSHVKPLGLTTPDPVEIHRLLAELHAEGVTHAAFESSSIGLEQHRVDGVRMVAAGYTNLTRDHLDYHKTLEAYLDSKLRLFTDVLPLNGCAVLNADAEVYSPFEDACRARGIKLIRVGQLGQELRLKARAARGDGQSLTVAWSGKDYQIELPLAGAFQASNVLVAAGLVLATGGDPTAVFGALSTLKGAAGRLEKVGSTSLGVPVYVDYAHTPDALETVLQALRPHTRGSLWVVFGCGGDRDAGKRPLMGQAAKAYADRVIVTDDNPRTEDAGMIRRAVLAGAQGAMEMGDRSQAIAFAVANAKPGDVVVIAGKGHETGQIIGRDVLPFNDAEEARMAISRVRQR